MQILDWPDELLDDKDYAGLMRTLRATLRVVHHKGRNEANTGEIAQAGGYLIATADPYLRKLRDYGLLTTDDRYTYSIVSTAATGTPTGGAYEIARRLDLHWYDDGEPHFAVDTDILGLLTEALQRGHAAEHLFRMCGRQGRAPVDNPCAVIKIRLTGLRKVDEAAAADAHTD